jgi:hypothetical protein
MPRYLKPNANGIVYQPTATMPSHRAAGLTQAAPDQTYPCHADGTPVTEQELADIATAKQSAKLAELAPIIDRILAAVADSGIAPPTDFADAEAKLLALEDTELATQCAVRMLGARTELVEAGGTWADVLTYVANQ